MLLLKYLLLSAGIAMFVIAAGILSYDIYLLIVWRHGQLSPVAGVPRRELALRWRTSVAFVLLAWAPLLIAAGIVIIPSRLTSARTSQFLRETRLSSQPSASVTVFSEHQGPRAGN